MATTISTQDLIDVKRDIDDIGKAVNEKAIVSPRYGEDFKSLPMIADEAQATIGEWQAAINLITQEGGVPALAVSTASGENQQTINDFGGAKWRNKAGGYDLNARVMLESGDIVKSIVDGNTNNPNVGMVGWITPNLIVYPEVFGAVAGEEDSSEALKLAVIFCSTNGCILDGRGRTYNGNSIVLKDNTHIKRISINSNLYDTMNSVLTTDYGMLTPLKNVTLDTVYIDGKRELHTNVGTTMDGGRCAVLIRRPIDGLVIRNCKMNNAVTDALMLFPVDWAITAENWTHFVKNVTIENSEMFWNGRWGISADSAKHMTLRNVKAKFNGLDVAGGGDYTTGKSARLLNGKYYGGGFDLEEYHGFAYSKDINIINCDMTENASTGLLFERTGELSGTTEITITGGNFDSGTSVDSSGRSIAISAYSDTGAISAYKLTISQPNLNGGDLYLRKCQYADVSQLLNLNVIHIDQSVVIADKVYNFVYDNPTNATFLSGIRQGVDDFLGTNNTESTVWLHTENRFEAASSLKVRAGGVDLGGISFQKAQGAGTAGLNIDFMNGDTPIVGISQYGSIFPSTDSVASLGLQARKFKDIFLTNAPTVGSDARLKTGVKDISEVEKTVASELKKNIKTYRIIGDELGTHVGMIAQEIVEIFSKHGLDAHNYKIIHFENDRYSVRYEQLIMFILSA